MNENIQVTRLANGLTILTEKMPDLRSATIGIWLKKGSRHEPSELNGIYHFIEHAVFKGTNRRSAFDIATESDRLGGNLDAFTSHESTGFVMKVVDKAVSQAFDLLADMVINPLFDKVELRREQKVIIEEMKMVEDSPEEYLGELFNQSFFPNHPLGLPIEGTRKTVKTFDHETTAAFHQETFTPGNLIVAAAGNVEHAQIVELANKLFAAQKTEIRNPKSEIRNPVMAAPIMLQKKPDLEQAHLVIATPFVEAKSEKRYAAHLLTNIIGGGTSSRLWQSVREKRGLAYSVGANSVSFQDCGVFSIYAGTSPAQLEKVVDLAIGAMRKLVKRGVTATELELVKEQAAAAILFGLEDSSVRAASLAENEMIHGRQISPDETLANFQKVSTADIQNLAAEFFKTEKIALAALGNLNDFKIKRSRFETA